jgi:hypothetical protein
MNLTYIEWDDSTSPQSGPWINEDDPQLDISKPHVIVTVGFVVRENEHYVQLASSSDIESCDSGDFKGTQVGGVMNIPQRQISKRIEFEVSDKVKLVPRIEYKRIGGAPQRTTRKATRRS